MFLTPEAFSVFMAQLALLCYGVAREKMIKTGIFQG
jgi:hypothetical protein